MQKKWEKNQSIETTRKDTNDCISKRQYCTVIINILPISKKVKENINLMKKETEDITKIQIKL